MTSPPPLPSREPPLTEGQRAYLAAFDNWLHTVWKQSPLLVSENEQATALKDACLIDIASIRMAMCRKCHTAFEMMRGPGRPRKYCYVCRPRRLSRR